MPGISPIKILGNLKFLGASLTLPTREKASNTKEKWSKKSFKDRLKAQMDGTPQTIPPWFTPREPGYKPHQESCDKIGANFKDFHDAMIDAVQFSHDMWKLQAKFKDLKVMAVSAIGAPGCLDGPELESNIKNAPMVASFSGNMKKHRDAVATGVSKCFKKWQGKVMVPRLPRWPGGPGTTPSGPRATSWRGGGGVRCACFAGGKGREQGFPPIFESAGRAARQKKRAKPQAGQPKLTPPRKARGGTSRRPPAT